MPLDPETKETVGKFKELRQQLALLPTNIPGLLMTISCPWCGGESVQDRKFCCDDLRKAIHLIMSEPAEKVNHA